MKKKDSEDSEGSDDEEGEDGDDDDDDDDDEDSSNDDIEMPGDEEFSDQLERHIEQFKKKFGESFIEVKDPIVDCVEIILYLDPAFLMQGVCNAWGIDRKSWISVRIL